MAAWLYMLEKVIHRGILNLGFVLLLVVVGISIPEHPLYGQSDGLQRVRLHWHDAGIAEARRDWRGAHAIYEALQQEVIALPLTMREWYRGTAYYGAAICDAEEHDTLAARVDLSHAAEHHFWNFQLVRSIPALSKTLGTGWIDSLAHYWFTAKENEALYWQPQVPIVIKPEPLDTSSRYPILIALHGGNACFEEFAEYWKAVADTLKVIVVVPPGIYRISQVTNSWGDSLPEISGYLITLVQEIKSANIGDTSKMYVAGFSQGAQAATAFCIGHPELVQGAVAICGFDFHLPAEEELKFAAEHHAQIYAITAAMEQPNYANSQSALAEACARTGIRYRSLQVEQTVHEMPIGFTRLFKRAWHWLTRDCPFDSHKKELLNGY